MSLLDIQFWNAEERYIFRSHWTEDRIEYVHVEKNHPLGEYTQHREMFVSFQSVLPCFRSIFNALRRSS